MNVVAREGRHEFHVEGFVSNHVSDVILGCDFLREHNALRSFGKAEVILNGVRHRLHARVGPSWCRRVVLAESVVIPGRTECVVPTYVVFDRPSTMEADAAEVWATETANPALGLHVSRVLLPNRCSDVPVRIMNTSNEQSTLPAGTVLAPLQPVSLVDQGGSTKPHSPLLTQRLSNSH